MQASGFALKGTDVRAITVILVYQRMFMSWEEIKLQISDQIRQLMEDRAIPEDYIKQVIDNAETTGDKLYQPEANRYLVRSRLGEVTVYVEYSDSENSYMIHTAYWHGSKIG
jgi:hypothetical protein